MRDRGAQAPCIDLSGTKPHMSAASGPAHPGGLYETAPQSSGKMD
jgi:hypothetical protein